MSAKILIITDFSPNENGFAGPQTAYHFIQLLQQFPHRLLIHASHYEILKPNAEWQKDKDYRLFHYCIDFTWNNRFFFLLNFVKKLINPRFIYITKSTKKFVCDFTPTIIIGIPNSPFLYKAIEKYGALVPSAKNYLYIMDDYKLYEDNLVRKPIQKSLKHIDGWCSISENMATIFQKKFKYLANKPYAVLQNPVPLAQLFEKKQPSETDTAIRIVYAGSVYPNHKDGLLRFIECVNNSHQNIVLDIYTKPEFRPIFLAFESNKVQYKGHLTYKNVSATLREYDFGLVTETFEETFAHFAQSSIQTKINDYILSGCLIIAFGPINGVCVQHIQASGLGLALTDRDPILMESFLQALPKNRAYIERLQTAQNSFVAIRKQMESELFNLLKLDATKFA